MYEENVTLAELDVTDADAETPEIDTGDIKGDWNSVPADKSGLGNAAGGDERDSEQKPAAQPEDSGAHTGTEKSEADQSFTLKHLSDVRTVGRDEVITLAQKGLDYDRIRGKYEEASAALARTNDTYALPRSEQPGLREQTPEETREHAAAEKRQSDIREFLAEYGTGIDPKTIPQEVWQSVAQGKTLLGAYQAWELKKLRLESAASQKNSENKTRSAGSRQSTGDRQRDAITDNWYED